MYEILKKRIIRNVLTMALGIFIIVAVVVVICNVDSETSFSVFLKPPVEIKAGTDLAQYHNQKVTCSFRYVLNGVVNFYHRNDSSENIYTCGYVVMDDTMKRTFCVFVPPDEKDTMDEMMQKTWNVMNGQKEYIPSLQVEGYVRKLSDEKKHFYVEALNWVYGEGYADRIGNVYYIDDENSCRGDQLILTMGTMWLIMLIPTLYACVVILRWLNYRKVMERFLMQNHISEALAEKEFLRADEVGKDFWISPRITVFIGLKGLGVLKNKDIVWAFLKTHHGKTATYSVEVYTIDKKRYSASVTYADGKKILEYYKQKFPYIVIEKDREKNRLFQHDFDSFLQLQYTRYEKEDFSETETSKVSDYNPDICGYQNLSFDKETGEYENNGER